LLEGAIDELDYLSRPIRSRRVADDPPTIFFRDQEGVTPLEPEPGTPSVLARFGQKVLRD